MGSVELLDHQLRQLGSECLHSFRDLWRISGFCSCFWSNGFPLDFFLHHSSFPFCPVIFSSLSINSPRESSTFSIVLSTIASQACTSSSSSIFFAVSTSVFTRVNFSRSSSMVLIWRLISRGFQGSTITAVFLFVCNKAFSYMSSFFSVAFAIVVIVDCKSS